MSSIHLREVNRFHDTTEAIFACLMFIVCVISPSAIWISWRFFLDFSVIFLDFLLDVHRLCNLSLSHLDFLAILFGFLCDFLDFLLDVHP